MRIPHIIDDNAITAYEVANVFLRRGHIKCDNFTWDEEFIKKLRDQALLKIVENWKNSPLYNELTILADKLQLLELLPTDLPLELTVPIIEDDFYWKRCYKARWPNSPEPNRRLKYYKPINIYESKHSASPEEKPETSKSDYDDKLSEQEINIFSLSSSDTFESQMLVDGSAVTMNTSGNSKYTINRKSSLSIVIMKSWKQTFLQKFVEEEIQRMKPDMFNPEYIKELTDKYGEYILCLNLKQLKSSKNEDSYDHISLHSLLARLTNLIEFSVCFNEANLCDNFTWHSTKVSDADCELLGNGVEKSRIKILRVLRSNIDCNKVKLLIRPLVHHKFLHTIDLSHCKISDEGAQALAGMLTENTVVERLILVNNKIGPIGAQGLSHYMCQAQCRLIELNLKLNPLNVEGGKYIGTALARGAKTLRCLNISCCGLTSQNLHIGLTLSLNDTLQKLDLSNNNLGEAFGENLLKGMENNSTLIHLDLRMCGLLPELVQEIEKIVRKNLESLRQILLSPPSAELIL